MPGRRGGRRRAGDDAESWHRPVREEFKASELQAFLGISRPTSCSTRPRSASPPPRSRAGPVPWCRPKGAGADQARHDALDLAATKQLIRLSDRADNDRPRRKSFRSNAVRECVHQGRQDLAGRCQKSGPDGGERRPELGRHDRGRTLIGTPPFPGSRNPHDDSGMISRDSLQKVVNLFGGKERARHSPHRQGAPPDRRARRAGRSLPRSDPAGRHLEAGDYLKAEKRVAHRHRRLADPGQQPAVRVGSTLNDTSARTWSRSCCWSSSSSGLRPPVDDNSPPGTSPLPAARWLHRPAAATR